MAFVGHTMCLSARGAAGAARALAEGHGTRLAARLVPDELMRQLCRIDPGTLCGRLRPLMLTLDRTMNSAWRSNPYRYAQLRLARECLRKKKARQRNPSERGVINA